jgi:hypothetical protein
MQTLARRALGEAKALMDKWDEEEAKEEERARIAKEKRSSNSKLTSRRSSTKRVGRLFKKKSGRSATLDRLFGTRSAWKIVTVQSESKTNARPTANKTAVNALSNGTKTDKTVQRIGRNANACRLRTNSGITRLDNGVSRTDKNANEKKPREP